MGDSADPALLITGLDTGLVNLCNKRNSPCDLCGLPLCATHTAQAGGNIKLPCQIGILADAQNQTSCIEEGIKCAVNDALRSDVHPAAGGHLPVVGNTHSSGTVKALEIVNLTDHEAVGDNDTRS